ncbi:Molybdopterin biosynthesis MoaE [Mycena haematopus]|nr:Molybdopterin biosynthesis MoaE [Mycena haematopus]
MDSAASAAASLEFENGRCVLAFSLDIQEIISWVESIEHGATAVFIGTTRNSFKDKVVTRLEYQAYSTLAIKTMASIVREVQASAAQNPDIAQPILRCAVHHRLGVVPVGEPSIVIAVSAPHRKEAFVACERILEDIKAKVPIWKREYYKDESEESAEWKANQ